MKRISIFLVLLLIFIAPIQTGMADSITDDDTESDETNETTETIEEELTDIPEEDVNEPVDNSEKENNENIEETPPIIEEDESIDQNESEESTSEDSNDESEEEFESDSDEIIDEELPEEQEDEESDESKEELEEDEEELLEQMNRITPFQATGSHYEPGNLSAAIVGQTNDTISLRLTFTGNTTVDEGNTFVHFRFPNNIDVSDENIESLSGQFNGLDHYGFLFGLIPTESRPKEATYNSDQINRIGNTFYVSYEMVDENSLIGLTRRKFSADHTFTLDITLNARAISIEGAQSYTFQALGSKVANPSTTYPRQTTVTIDVPESGSLSLANVPDTLNFQTIPIGVTNYVPLSRNSNHVVNVEDTRNFSNDWTLTAQSEQSFSTVNNTIAPLRIGVLTDDEIFHSMEESVLVATSNESRPDATSVNLNSLVNKTIAVAIDEFDLLSNVPYTTTIEWTLTDAP